LTILKSIVVALALANIGYFLWMHDIAQSQSVSSAAGAPGQTLQLASEVPAPRAAVPAGVPDTGAATGATGPAGATPANTTTDNAVKAADVAKAADAANSATSSNAAPTVAQIPPAPPAGAKRCVTVGPFKEVSEAAHAASTLRGSGYDPRQRVVDGDVWAGVWVYLPLPAARPASDQLLAKLKAAGIDDSLVMPGPAEGSVISLGLFSEQKRAQARVAQVQALGLNPGIADRKRTGNLYWIDVDLKPADGALNPADLQGEAGHINRLEIKSCPAPVAAAAAPASAS